MLKLGETQAEWEAKPLTSLPRPFIELRGKGTLVVPRESDNLQGVIRTAVSGTAMVRWGADSGKVSQLGLGLGLGLGCVGNQTLTR